jgi:hypothetical protein
VYAGTGSPLPGAWQTNAQINMSCTGISSKSSQPEDAHEAGWRA